MDPANSNVDLTFLRKLLQNPYCFWLPSSPLLFGNTCARARELVGCDAWPGGITRFSTVWGENKNLLKVCVSQ